MKNEVQNVYELIEFYELIKAYNSVAEAMEAFK